MPHSHNRIKYILRCSPLALLSYLTPETFCAMLEKMKLSLIPNAFTEINILSLKLSWGGGGPIVCLWLQYFTVIFFSPSVSRWVSFTKSENVRASLPSTDKWNLETQNSLPMATWLVNGKAGPEPDLPTPTALLWNLVELFVS